MPDAVALCELLRREGITDERVLDAIRRVPRERFVDTSMAGRAWANRPLPIGHGQTISQPYVVALMTELVGAEPGTRVLEVGTGSGYQAAILAALGCTVYSIERVRDLAVRAAGVLDRLGFDVRQRVGDGSAGWPEEAPFDAILVAAAAEEIPAPLVAQLRPGGRLVAPVGAADGSQWLEVLDKGEDGSIRRRRVAAVRFVPLVPASGN